MLKKFSGQSYKWPSYEIEFVGHASMPDTVKSVRLHKVEAGNLTKLTASEGGEWHGAYVDFSGDVSVSKHSAGASLLALASSGSWSGGSNYSGWIFGKPGAIIWLHRKGDQKWLVIHEDGPAFQTTPPGAKPVEI